MTSLVAYIVRRLILLVFVVLGVTVLIFAITMMFPPDIRAYMYIRNVEQVRHGVIEDLIKKYGLDQPLYVQYFNWLSQVLQGNLGWSHAAGSGGMPVVDAIRTKWPYTFEIVMFAAPIIIFVGIYVGVQAAIHRNGIIDQLSRVTSIVGWSLPSFWVGMLLIAIVGATFHVVITGAVDQSTINYMRSTGFVHVTGVDIFDGVLNAVFYQGRSPASTVGNVSTGMVISAVNDLSVTVDALIHVILPVIVIVTIDVALLIRVMRSSMLEALSKPYITTAKAKGLKKNVVIYKHARRNALIPVATLSGMLVAGLLGGLVITETVFGFPGIGNWAATSAVQVDIPAVLGYAILSAFIFVIANLVVDVLYAYIDPRIRLD
jgi:peptide/nickel transport system permease protein